MDAKLKAITDAAAKVIDAYVDKHGKEVVMSRAEIFSLLDKNGVKWNSAWQPSDHCYNLYNKGLIEFDTSPRLFEYVSRGKYILRGSHYAYTGDLIWSTRENGKMVRKIIGRRENGVRVPESQG